MSPAEKGRGSLVKKQDLDFYLLFRRNEYDYWSFVIILTLFRALKLSTIERIVTQDPYLVKEIVRTLCAYMSNLSPKLRL